MSRASREKVRVHKRYWHDKHTNTFEHFITISHRGYFIKVPFDQARRVVDEVHDLCDARDRELRGHQEPGVHQ